MSTDPTVLLTQRITTAAQRVDFEIEVYGQIKHWPLIALTRNAKFTSDKTKHIYLSSGIHGDEPAGPLTLCQLLKENSLPRHHHYTIFPVLNPAGLLLNTRENSDGCDLNRDYDHPSSEEIRFHTKWIDANIQSIDIGIHLHEDWESAGFYLYEVNFHQHKTYGEAMLKATARHIPTDTATEIDGRPAVNGMIRPDHIPEDLDGLPEALYLLKKFNCLNYTLETPSSLPIEKRIRAMKSALMVLL
jgi:predicted deacylase